jgi:hypothetical protein
MKVHVNWWESYRLGDRRKQPVGRQQRLAAGAHDDRRRRRHAALLMPGAVCNAQVTRSPSIEVMTA